MHLHMLESGESTLVDAHIVGLVQPTTSGQGTYIRLLDGWSVKVKESIEQVEGLMKSEGVNLVAC